jgi:hydrogenase maturation protease
MPRVLILGYGNPLRGDDGFGWYAAERLASMIRDPEVEVRALHQLTPELAETVSRAAGVIFIDAARAGLPGTVTRQTIAPAPGGAFTHHVTPSTLLAAARRLYGCAPTATLFQTSGESFDYQMALSPASELALGDVCRQVLSLINMNPYAAQLGERDALQVVEATPQQLQSVIQKLGPARTGKAPAPGKWSPREILCHLADTELVFAFRLRQTLAEDHHVIQPFDQDQWGKNYHAYDAAAALAVFSAVRHWNLALIGAAGPAARSKRVMHPERGEMTFEVIIQTMAGHDINHVRQLEAMAS